VALDFRGRRWLWIGIAAAVVVIAVACVLVFVVFQDSIFGSASTGPEKAVQDMLGALEAKDIDAYFAVMDPDGLNSAVSVMGVTLEEYRAMVTDEMSYESMDFSGVKMQTVMAADGQTATVTIVAGKLSVTADGETSVEDIKDSGATQEYKAVLRDGKWYLDMGETE
jgi:hypothetical protein